MFLSFSDGKIFLKYVLYILCFIKLVKHIMSNKLDFNTWNKIYFRTDLTVTVVKSFVFIENKYKFTPENLNSIFLLYLRNIC